MESSPTTCLPYKRTWKLRQSINKEHLKSTSGILGVFELVSLLTGFIALLHYVKIVAKTTVTNNIFFVTTGTTFAFRVVLFILMTFNLQQKLMASNKHWNLFMLIFTSITGVLLLISSSLLASEAVKLGDAYHSLFPEHTKCLDCSKINIAAVFGLLSGILFTADFCAYLRQNESTTCARRETRVTVHHVAPVNENGQTPTTSQEATS